MSNLTRVTTATIAVLLASAAMAQEASQETTQDAYPEVIQELGPDSGTLAADFEATDLDQDESLNSDEFVSFAIKRAEAGDEVFKDIVLGGAYDMGFKTYDADASGTLDVSELGGLDDSLQPDENPEKMETAPAEMTPIDPDFE